MYCRRCDYRLVNLAAGPCPECGRPFDPLENSTFREQPKRKERLAMLLLGTVWAVCLAGIVVMAMIGLVVIMLLLIVLVGSLNG